MKPELLCKYLDNTATEEEMRQVVDWLDANPVNQRELDELDRLFHASAIYGPEVLARRKSRIRMLGGRLLRYTAELAAVLVVGLGVGTLWMKEHLSDWSQRTTALEVPAGHYLSMQLEDGSTVWLNSETRLEYPLVFAGRERRVKVSGEAFFDVAHDPEHPFIVETFACDVEVIGTQFDVVAEEQAGNFSASLVEGRVKVTNRLAGGESVYLRPNESVHLVGNRLECERMDDPDAFLWTEGMIGLKGVTFRELMDRFERGFGVTIVVDRERMPELNYNHGKIRISDGVESALRLLQISSDFTYEMSADHSVITIR